MGQLPPYPGRWDRVAHCDIWVLQRSCGLRAVLACVVLCVVGHTFDTCFSLLVLSVLCCPPCAQSKNVVLESCNGAFLGQKWPIVVKNCQKFCKSVKLGQNATNARLPPPTGVWLQFGRWEMSCYCPFRSCLPSVEQRINLCVWVALWQQQVLHTQLTTLSPPRCWWILPHPRIPIASPLSLSLSLSPTRVFPPLFPHISPPPLHFIFSSSLFSLSHLLAIPHTNVLSNHSTTTFPHPPLLQPGITPNLHYFPPHLGTDVVLLVIVTILLPFAPFFHAILPSTWLLTPRALNTGLLLHSLMKKCACGDEIALDGDKIKQYSIKKRQTNTT